MNKRQFLTWLNWKYVIINIVYDSYKFKRPKLYAKNNCNF